MSEKFYCRRSNGTLRAWFHTKEEAEDFAADPVNWPTYKGDIPALCKVCGYWHLNRPEWIAEPGDVIVINGAPCRLLLRRPDGGTLWEKITEAEAQQPAPEWLTPHRRVS